MVYLLIKELPQTLDEQGSAEALKEFFTGEQSKGYISAILQKGNELSRRESIFSLLLLLKAIKKLFPDICSLTLAKSEGGKPHFTEGFPCFSISHSDGVCAVAISEREVGVDIQGSRESLDRISQRYFSESERRERDSRDLWVMKEAYAKLCGIPLPHILPTDISDKASFHLFDCCGMGVCIATDAPTELEIINT